MMILKEKTLHHHKLKIMKFQVMMMTLIVKRSHSDDVSKTFSDLNYNDIVANNIDLGLDELRDIVEDNIDNTNFKTMRLSHGI